MSAQERLDRLRSILREVTDLQCAAAVLGWDQQTYMPSRGAAPRGRQIATLTRLAHEAFTAPEVGRLLDALEPHAAELPPDSDDARLIDVVRRDWERDTKVPSTFWSELSEHAAEAFQVWTQARPANDFARVEPHLERTLELSRRYGSFFPEADHMADPLIDMSDEGMTVASLRPLFARLRQELVPMVEGVSAAQPELDAGLYRSYPVEEQIAFGLEIVRAFGFDFERGRQDRARHPFATSFATSDVRITTRAKERDLTEALFSTLHEAGHAMYEQGIDPALDSTPLASGVSSGVHESQSRLWENLVGRDRSFWRHWFPALRERFPKQLQDIQEDAFYVAINRVRPSLIRTDADELTYNLHVVIRFDLELDLLDGALSVSDLPEAWRERYREDLGVTPQDNADGVLQDVHWFSGLIGGAFQGYTLGNILSAQFFEAARNARPHIDDELARGRYDALHGWLRQNVYRHGRKFPPQELVERATGRPMVIEPYLRYLRTKYGPWLEPSHATGSGPASRPVHGQTGR